MTKKTNRRTFIKYLTFIAASPIVAKIFNPKKAFASEQIVKLDDPTAVALGYNHSAEKVDIKKWPKKADKTQLCSNCRFLQGEAKKVKEKEGEWVGCQLFPGKLVNNKGWCNSWTAKS